MIEWSEQHLMIRDATNSNSSSTTVNIANGSSGSAAGSTRSSVR